ncbi:MAG: DUF4173 domain-containing protein [Verrucomicrobia bacterium]|nr:DUF4173 domain-containing protein [Verrucomicrobiota bacterium]
MNSSPSPQETHTTPPLSGRLKLLCSVILLTVAVDFLTFGINLGIGVTLLCGLIWFILRLNRPARTIDWKDLLLYGLMAISAIQTAIELSFSNWLVLFLLTIYASGHFLHRQIAPYWRRALEGLFGLLNVYLVFFNLKRGLREAKHSSQSSTFKDSLKQGKRWFVITLPASIITIAFLFLFSSGNALMGDEIKNTLTNLAQWIIDYQFPSFLRITFWICIAFLLLSLLSRSPLSLDLARIEKHLPGGWAAPTDLAARIWSTRILLIAVNVIFFAANSLDVFYLWMETKLPDEINFSEYVHQGVYNLIACVALAAGVLLIVFQQNKQITNTRGQKFLANLWIAQNFLLISSVLLRLHLYIDTYHLSLLRLYVAFFLILVVVGFVLLAIKINQQRNFSWLINSNLLAVFLLFFVVQLINDRAFVARYNYEQALQSDKGNIILDVDYLASLGPPAWPVLQWVAEDVPQFGNTANLAKNELLNTSYDEQYRLRNSDWRSWQYRRWIASNSLPNTIELVIGSNE